MAETPTEQYDDTGKAVFDDAYNQPDPRMYYEDLGRLGYRIAGEAEPHIERTLAALREVRGIAKPKVIDIGCSYGINAALQNTDLTLDELDEHYRTNDVADWNREQILERDIKYFAEHASEEKASFVGMDVSANALQYAVDAGLMDSALVVNLEENKLKPEEAAEIKGADLILSTGAVGYISAATFEQVLDASGESRPWVANSVLRMFPYDEILKLLEERGYVTEKYEGTLIQRSFATDEERLNVMKNLEEIGVDPTGKEAEGNYHAEYFLSRPREEASKPIFKPLETRS